MGGSLSCASGKACGCGVDKQQDKTTLEKRKKTPWKRKKKGKKFVDEVDAKRRDTDELRNKASELLPHLSQHDQELVEEHIRTTERRYGELQAAAEKKRRSYGTLGGDLGHIRQEADQYLQWLDSTRTSMSSELRLGFPPEQAEEQLQVAKELSIELEEKQVNLEAVRQKAEALLHDLPVPERSAVEHLVRQVQAEHNQVCELVTMRCAQLEEGRQLRLDFASQVEKEDEWLENRVKAADKLDTIRLLASEAEKQADKCKSLAAKVNNRLPHLEELKASGDKLKETCTEEGADEVDSMLKELFEKQSDLAARLKKQEEHLRNCAAARRLHEADCQKVEHWCKETDIKCSGDLPLDCATEVLEEQLKQYKALSNMAHVFESLVKETMERGEGFKAHLHEADLPILEQQLVSLQDMFNSTANLVKERTQQLETTIASRQAVQSSVEAATKWLEDVQEQIKAADIPIGTSVEDAEQSLQKFEALEKSLAEYQPTIAELNSNVESLRAEGQLSQADAILRLTSQHEMLIDRVAGSRNNRQTAIAVRQQHRTHLAELLKSLEDGQREMESIAEQGVSVPERIDLYKALQEKLLPLKAEVSIAEDHAQQIAVDCPQEDRASVLSEVESAQKQLTDLLSSLEVHIQQCNQIQHDRDDFEAAMNSTVAWLEEKEEILASLRPLHLDSDKVDPVMEKHKVLSSEAIQRLSEIKEKASMELSHCQQMEENVPETFTEKLQQIDALETSIREAIKKKEEYLQEAKADRQQLETSMHQVSDWLRGAEDMLDSGYDGLDYSTIDQTLTEFSDYFSEASLCQDEMDQVSELSDKLLTTLDSNDTETLHQSLASVSKRLSHVLASSQKQQQLLETKTAQWHSFQENMLEMNGVLDQLEAEWVEVDKATLITPQELDSQLHKVKMFTAKVEDHRPTVDNLNETARSLNRTANSSSSADINQLIFSLNERWDAIVLQAESKQAALEELKEQWQDFSAGLHGAEDVVRYAQETVASVTGFPETQADLVDQMDTLRSVNDELESVSPQMERLKTASASLQKALPSAEAKVTLQERFLTLLENYERLQLSVQEQTGQVQEELDDRDNFQTEVAQTLTWLTDTQSSVRTMDPDAADASDNVEKCKIYQQEIAVRMEQMRRLTVLQETKYASMGKELPQEMRQQLEEMHSLEKVVSLALREKEEELIHLREDREEYRATLATVTEWLQRADQQLQERIVSIPEARVKHQELLSEFDSFKQNLDKLRSKGGDIIRHSPEQDEKQQVQKTIADINRQWLSLQAQTADRTQELSEAADLAHAVEDVANSVEVWVNQAESVLSEELNWSDFDSVREQLKSHRRLTKDLEQNEDKLVALNAMVKQLDQVCDTTQTMAAVAALRQRVQLVSGEGQSRLGQLEDANKKIEDYEKEIADLTRWMEETKTHISMRDTTRDLKEQLSVQERLLEDIKSNKARAEVVLDEHASLRDRSGETTPSQGAKLLKEIGHLEEAAEYQCGELRAAVSEQEQYETEIRHLNAAISEAQQQLLASPVQASSVEALKQQIAEHNTLASQIKMYQARVSEINEKSRQLSLRVAQSSTMLPRKRYLPEMMYRTWVSPGSSDPGIEAHSTPVSQSADSFDSGLDTGVNLSQSVASPSLSTTLQSQSTGLRPAVFPSTPRRDTMQFKPISDTSKNESSTSFRSDDSLAADTSGLSTTPSGAPGSWLRERVDPYRVKSASDTHLPGSSFMRRIHGEAAAPSSAGGKVTTPRSKFDAPWSLTGLDQPAKTSTPRGRGRLRSTADQPAFGRRAFSHSPEKGQSSYKPPQMQSLSPSLSSASVQGRGMSSLLVGAGGGGGFSSRSGGGVRSSFSSRLQEETPAAQETRVRSSSFGQRVEPLGRPLGSGPEVAELNASWNTLQKQVATREKELQHALQKQERYQQAVQELTAKMERAQIRLARTPASVAADVNTQMRDYKETLAELETIREDIARVRERGRQIMEVSDAEGNKAMEATLTMLNDRITSLQTLADNKGKQLQDVAKQRKKHEIELSAYKKRVSEMESWLGEMKVRHATTPLPTDDPAALEQQLQDNRELQQELNRHLQQISDLAIRCDNLCEMEPPREAEKLRNQLSGLQSRLGDFKLVTIEKQTALRNALKDSEKRKKEMDDYESNVSKLKQWMTDTKQMTVPEVTPSTFTLPDHQQLQQDLESDLIQHRQLVRQISTTARGPTATEAEARVMAPTISETELHNNWQSLQRDLALKTEELEKIIRKKKAGEPISSTASGVGDTSQQLREVQALMEQLTLCWQQLQVQVEDKQLRLDTALAFQQQMQSALAAMSSWLDVAEQIVLSPSSSSQSQHDRIRQNEALQRELRSLQSEITTLTGQAQNLLSDATVQSHGLIQESLTNLNQRVTMLESQAVSRGDELRHAQHQWQQYHDDVRALRARMQELQTSVMVPAPASTVSMDQLVSDVNKLETQLKKCESQLDELKARENQLSAHQPRGVVPSELSSLRSSYMDLQRKVVERKASLLQSVSVQEQYEKMLKDYADFLETAEGKLRTEAISARDLPHLKQQLSAHKEFFSDLEVHKAMLDSLASQCDPATQDQHGMQHTRLSNLTHVLADQASLHGQRLERLVRQWNDLADKLGHLQTFLAQVEDDIPKPIASGDSLTTIQDKLAKFKRLQGQLADERPTVFQAVDRGKQILHSVACPALENAVTELADKWVELNTRLVHELKKTETIGEQLQIFEAEAMVLKTWMSTAAMKLEDLKHLSEEDAANIGNIRAKVEQLLHFRKDVQNQLPLKAKVMSVGKQLMANRNYDTRGLDSRLARIEEEWTQLEQSISSAEESLHQAQMELMPSRQALHELQIWMEEMEKALKGDGNVPIKTQADIEIMLNKYKGYKIDLASKQLTMDFVNQAVLQPGPHEIDVPHEKLEFSEKLAELNQHWEKVSSDIKERLKSLEQLSSQWTEYEAALAQLQSWFRQQEDKIKKYRLIGHEVGVKQTLKDCKMLQDQLQGRKEEMDSIKSLGQSLIELMRESPGCQRSIRESLDALTQQWDHLQQQTMQLESLLTDMLGQWARYHADLHSLNQVIAQTEYTLNRYSLVGADMPTLVNQVEKLKRLEAELKQHSSHLDSFSTLANQLCQVCEPPVQAEVKATVSDLKTKWRRLSADLSTRRAEFERCLAKWREYEREYDKICDWLTQKEEECNGLVAMREDVALRQECLDKSETLQQELDEIQTQLSALYRLSDDLTKNMGTSTIVLLTSRQSAIEQRLLALRQLLSQHIQALHEDLSQVNRFREAFATVKKFLDHAEAVLAPGDPNKTSEQAVLQRRLDQLKQLSAQFQANSDKLDEVNDLGYRLALDSSDSRQLLDLNHTWHRLLADCQDRCKTLQAHLLAQQDFTAKCEAWMTFLATTERDLSTEIAGNLADLMEQQRKCQKFESDMYSNQQILHAIISDGQRMMRAREVEDPREFEQKLRLLAEQWQSVIRRATQRKNIIDTTIQNWHLFNTLSGQLRRWLNEKEQGLKVFEFDTISLQQIRHLLDRVKTVQSEFKMQEESFRQVHDLGSTLLQRADASASEEIKLCTAQLQHGWLEVYSRLEEHRARLEALQDDWRECEEDIEDILSWLRNIRNMLSADIPNTYDELQADLARCKDIATSFLNSEDKRQRLLAREKKLGRMIQAEDMNVLHQRIRLLNKQWDELASQAGLREHRLHDSTFRWSNLGEQIRALMDWIDDMEVKIVSSREVHVEDLLTKLETEYQDAMTEKGRELEEVVARGQQLMKNSSEVRASDIEQRLQRLQDKWAHLQGVAEFRKRKLHETVLAVKQLDNSMRNLSRWLATMEQELATPVVYNDTDMQEIHTHLQHTQDIQRDIEHHSAGVSSVLNLCEVLLHDSDACPTETEFNALQHAMKNLDRRWKNICSLCPERRAHIKETWELWEAFHTDCKRFSEWLGDMELEVGESEATMPPGAVSKEDLRKYETLQRKVHDRLDDLESINKQYRRLAKERRTDSKGLLRSNMQEANDRWDAVQQRVTAIMQGLRHSASIREDFITTRLSLMQWLTEVDMQLTNIEHLAQMDVLTKMKEIQRIEEEIDDRRHRMDYLSKAAILLVQQGSSEDAIRVQQELDEFKLFSRQVLDRVSQCRAKLERISAGQVEDIAKVEERESRLRSAEQASSFLVGQEPPTAEWDTRELEAYLESSPPESPPHKRRAGAAGVELPRASVSPMRRSMSPLRRSASPARRSGSPSRWRKDVTDSLTGEGEKWQTAKRERSAKIDVLMEQLADAIKDASALLDVAEREMQTYSSASADPSARHVQLQSLVECETLIDKVQRLDRLLKIETGTTTIPSADHQIAHLLERWSRLQSLAADRDLRLSQQQHDLVKFRSDLDSLLAWLDEAEALQASHDHLPSDISQLNIVIRQHKDFMTQLESKKARVLSIQLLSKTYIDPKTAEGRHLRNRLRELNRRWEAITARVAETQHSLQGALLQCQEFHHTVHDCLLWLEGAEAKLQQCEPVRLSADNATLWEKYNTLRELRTELESKQSAVMSLRETADQLLMSGELQEMAAARDKTHIIANRLRSLLHLTAAYIESLEKKLDIRPSALSREGRLPTSVHPTLRTRTRSPFALLRRLLFGEEPISLPAERSTSANLTTDLEAPPSSSTLLRRRRRGPLLYRVLRTALPLQLLLLLLLGFACLVPLCEDDYSCLLSNNLRHSLAPMLRYTDGAPPT